MPGPKPLSLRQQLVLSFVTETVQETGAPPTIREVMRHCGLRSPRGAELQLKALAKCGHLVHAPGLKRAYRLRVERPGTSVPIIGRAPAGHPTEQLEFREGTLSVPWAVGSNSFAVHVTGDSMRDAAILDGDIVVVDPRRQPVDRSVVLAVLDGSQTIKHLRVRGNLWHLEPANSDYPSLFPRVEGDRVVGCVVGLVRRMK
jgi:repressor LexA